MSATGSSVPQFKNLRDEVKYWKDLALAHEKEIERLRQQITGLKSPARKRSASPADDVTAQKRLKTSSMDPLDSEILHEDVYRYIAQHLTGKDLMAMSEVSKSWNEFAESQKIGDKVRLKVDLEAMSFEDFRIIGNSSRSYKEVSMKTQSDASSAAICLFADSAEKMTIDNTLHDDESEDFSKLKSLDLTVTAGKNSWILWSNMKQLEEFKLTVCGLPDYDDVDDDELEFVHKFLANQNSLKRLDLSGCTFVFLENFNEETSFQLEYLKANLSDNRTFLESSQQSLQTLEILSGSYKDEVRSVLMDFPILTKLEISGCNDEDWQDDGGEELPTNTTIKNLKLAQDGNVQLLPFNFVCQDILLALPELESLYIEGLTIVLIELVGFHLLKLKVLRCKNIEDGAWERYEEIKREAVEGTNLGIQLVVDT